MEWWQKLVQPVKLNIHTIFKWINSFRFKICLYKWYRLKDKQTTNNMHQRLSTVIKCHQKILFHPRQPPKATSMRHSELPNRSLSLRLRLLGCLRWFPNLMCLGGDHVVWSQIGHKWSHKMIQNAHFLCWAVHLLFQTIILAHGPCPHYLKPVTDVTSPLEKSGQRKRRPKPRQQTDFASWITISVIRFPTQPMDRNHLYQSH